MGQTAGKLSSAHRVALNAFWQTAWKQHIKLSRKYYSLQAIVFHTFQQSTNKSAKIRLPFLKHLLGVVIVTGMHVKARGELYGNTSNVKRFPVPDDKVPWSVPFSEYQPVEYTSKSVTSGPVWADPKDPSGITFNVIDISRNVDRRSYEGEYKVINGRPRNPKGRTGVIGRGNLGRWGPNHAADPIVTRWKRDSNNKIIYGSDGKPILQFVAALRRDCQQWALPGGMVDPGENTTVTVKREFGEEALNMLEKTDSEKKKINKTLEQFFQNGHTIYQGYVDDPRNTDNSWMETKAILFHDAEGTSVGAFKLQAGDDAAKVQWTDIDRSLKLYASHADFIYHCKEHLNAHW